MESLFPNTDNFFKYILTIGLVLILFALVYPLRKEQQLKLEAIGLTMEHEKLTNDINFLKTQGVELSALQESTQKQIDQLNILQQKNASSYLDIQKQKIELKEKFDAKKAEITSKIHQLDTKNIELRFKGNKQQEIKKQIWSYAVFKSVSWILGMVMAAMGFYFWLGSTYLDEQIKGGITQPSTGHHTVFVKCIDAFKNIYVVIISIVVFALIVYFSFRYFTA